MTTLVKVPLDAELAESLQEMAQTQGQSVGDVLANVVRQYLREARRQKIRQEHAHFEKMHTELQKRYRREHVAIHDGQVVDHDENAMSLAKRIRGRYGRVPILIAPVDKSPAPEFAIRCPRLVESE
jgi:metal-responsive CopG/Arc/MetJ family transcriptional regulator